MSRSEYSDVKGIIIAAVIGGLAGLVFASDEGRACFPGGNHLHEATSRLAARIECSVRCLAGVFKAKGDKK